MAKSSLKPERDAHDAAAEWYARLSSDQKTHVDQAEFDAWLDASPENADAYAATCALIGRLDAFADHPALEAWRADAQREEERARRPVLKRIIGPGIAASLAAAAAAAFLFFNTGPQEARQWNTARGETLEISLSDGSHIVLGSDSRLDMHYRRNRRDMDLTRGQAFFDVAHDAERPFVITTNGRTVTALGTSFDVRSYSSETTVTLVRGKVAIALKTGGSKLVLKPGQQFYLQSGIASVRNVNASAETAWRSGMLEFDGETLGEAVTRFNRNALHTITIADPRLADLRVSGVFRANDPQVFTAALAPAYPMKVTTQDSGDVVLTYKEREDVH